MATLLHRALTGLLDFSQNKAWQLLASTAIGAFFGVIAMFRTKGFAHGLISIGGGAACGLVAGGLLAWKDYYRTKSGSDDISPLAAVVFVVGFFGVVALAIFIAFLIMTG